MRELAAGSLIPFALYEPHNHNEGRITVWSFETHILNLHNCTITKKDMPFLEVKLYDQTASSLNGVSMVIKWQDQAGGKENTLLVSRRITGIQNNFEIDLVTHSGDEHTRPRHEHTPQLPVRLRPTDRLVLNALRARVPEGGQITKPIRLQELVDECAISRRQEQICLKRLTEMALINRLSDGMSLGNKEGYPYKLSQALL